MSQHLNLGRNGVGSNLVALGKGPFLHPRRFTYTQMYPYLVCSSVGATLEDRSTWKV